MNVCQEVFGKPWNQLSPEELVVAHRYRRKVSYFRNHAANVKRQRNNKRYTKRDLIRALGWDSACQLCRYSKSLAALDFHHLDPQTKEQSVMNLPIDRAVEEGQEMSIDLFQLSPGVACE